MPIARYAPSPSGPLHLGNFRTALLAWLQARIYGGRFILRMEDLDKPRAKPGAAQQIIDDLKCLGLDWDEGPDIGGSNAPYQQSLRTSFYQQALMQLYARGLIYPCYCSRKDIQQAASAPHYPASVYPGTCRDKYCTMSPEAEQIIDGRAPAWRFKVVDKEISFTDQLQGKQHQNLYQDVGDFVVRRSDGLFAYQLAVVVDDSLMGITDVLRGEDLLDSTARQIALYQALSVTVPDFWHVGLVRDQAGHRLSKRDGSDSLAQLKRDALNPEQIVGQLAYSCGLIDQPDPLGAKQLVKALDKQTFKQRLSLHISEH